MRTERRQILEMLASGKISADEAERLLERIGPAGSLRSPGGTAGSDGGSEGDADAGPRKGTGGKRRYLRVRVDGGDGDKVNVRVPLGLIKAGIKLKSLLPNQAHDEIEKTGLDLGRLAELEGEELLEALTELEVDVDSGDGDVVRVFCE